MSQGSFPASYEQLNAKLALADSDIAAAELHGISCGSICVLPLTRSSAGMVSLLSLDKPDAPLLDALADLTAYSSNQLKEGDAEFQLLLPPDSAPIEERTQALADWCQGFVVALLQGPYKEVAQLPEALQEVVQDLLAIAQAQASGDDPRGEDWALAELEEYVRAGVQLIYEEIYAANPITDPQA